MRKKEGKVYEAVRELLQQAGFSKLRTLEVATLNRGPDHLIVLQGETIGEYNHVSRHLSLYEN